MIGPEEKTGRPITKEYFLQQFSKIRYFIRNQNYKNPVVVHVYADTFPLDEQDIKDCVAEVLKDEKYISAKIRNVGMGSCQKNSGRAVMTPVNVRNSLKTRMR